MSERAPVRAARLAAHIVPAAAATPADAPVASDEARFVTLRLPDGREARLEIVDGMLRSDDLWKHCKLRTFDAGLFNTAIAKSAISFIDGDKGILCYRGYRIEDLAAKCSFLEVSYLLINGELPSRGQLRTWSSRVLKHTYLHHNLLDLLRNFRYDAHPMGMVISAMAAMSTFHPDANPALRGQDLYSRARDPVEMRRNKQVYRILGKIPTVAACAYRHRIGRPYNEPKVGGTGFAENFLYMLDRLSETDYKPNPVLAKALDVLFVLHAEHEMNASTAAMRHLASTGVDPFTAVAGAAAALYGPLHGGANEAVVRMLQEIGTADKVPAFIADVKNKKARLMGFGHRVYRNYDPRAKIIRTVAEQVFEVTGRNPLIEVALALEAHALQDSYFIERKLYPNVDFFSGIIYQAMGFPTDMFPVLFTIPRTAGWLAHWIESLDDADRRIFRPRQLYTGSGDRAVTALDERPDAQVRNTECQVSRTSTRRAAGTS